MKLLSRLELLLIWLLLFMLSACGDAQQIERGSLLALRGQRVCATVQDFYNRLEEEIRQDRHLQERIRVLSHPDPSGNLAPSPTPDFSVQLRVRREAYAALKMTYREMHRLASRFPDKRLDRASRSIGRNLSRLPVLRELPKEFIDEASRSVGKIVKNLQSRRLVAANRQMVLLTEAFVDLWIADRTAWQDLLQRIEVDFADALGQLPAQRFDEKRLAKEIDLPFTHAVNVGLYKLQMRRQASDRLRRIKDLEESVARVLDALVSVHLEFSRGDASQEAWQQALAALDRALQRAQDLFKEKR